MKDLYYDYNRDTGNDPSVLQSQIDSINERGFILSYINWLEEKLERGLKDRFCKPNMETKVKGVHQ